jgi:G:T-mismatch repair DNA endonuclease (very short patch repair protein)
MRKPTKPEKMMMKIIRRNRLPFKYVGDGSFLIGEKPKLKPDFIHRRNRKIVIEVLGDYWHSEDEFEMKKKLYQEYGYRCIGVWENELKNLDEEEIVERIRSVIRH